MTTVEAIKTVKEITGMSFPWNDRHYEALQMAIEVLKMQDVKDINNSEEYEIVDCYVKASIVEVLREIEETLTVIAGKMGDRA